MSNSMPFQYAILRYTGDIETGEFVNVGLALYSARANYLRVQLLTRYERLTDLFPRIDSDVYRAYILHLQSRFDKLIADWRVEQIPLLDVEQKPLDIREVFYRTLPSPDSALRFSEPIVGVTEDLDGLFQYLYDRLIMRHLKQRDLPSRSDEDVWHVFKRPLQAHDVLARLQPISIRTKRGKQEFEHTWHNGNLNVMLPQSFDLVKPTAIRDKAHRIIGRATVLQDSRERPHLVLLVGTPHIGEGDIMKAYQDARGMIQDQATRLSVELIEEDRAEKLAERVKTEIGSHR